MSCTPKEATRESGHGEKAKRTDVCETRWRVGEEDVGWQPGLLPDPPLVTQLVDLHSRSQAPPGDQGARVREPEPPRYLLEHLDGSLLGHDVELPDAARGPLQVLSRHEGSQC